MRSSAYDEQFYEHLPFLFPHADAKAWFSGNAAFAARSAFQNGTLQVAYLIIALRAVGLDTGPMTGFDNAKVDAEFFPEGHVKSNVLINIGFGDASKLFPRSPRFDFDQIAKIHLISPTNAPADRRRAPLSSVSEPNMKFTILPASWSPYVLSVFRIMVGLLFLEHGTGKFSNFPRAARHCRQDAARPVAVHRLHGTDRRRADRARPVHPPGRLRALRLHGGGLFHGAFPAGLLPGR